MKHRTYSLTHSYRPGTLDREGLTVGVNGFLTWDRLVDILFKSQRLRRRLSSQSELVKKYGPVRAKILRRRLDQLRAADDLAVMRHFKGRCHELTGDRKGELAVDLDGPYRLIFEPAANPAPVKDDGGLDWSRVTAIRILGVEDYHG